MSFFIFFQRSEVLLQWICKFPNNLAKFDTFIHSLLDLHPAFGRSTEIIDAKHDLMRLASSLSAAAYAASSSGNNLLSLFLALFDFFFPNGVYVSLQEQGCCHDKSRELSLEQLTGLGRGECISCTWVSFLRMDNIDLK
jgi:hypothetical protein